MFNIKTNNARKELEVTCDKTYSNISESFIYYVRRIPGQKKHFLPLNPKTYIFIAAG